MERLKNCKAILFDLDGTVYLDTQLIGKAKETLTYLRNKGIKIVYLSNNSSRSHKAYEIKLKKMGIYERGDICYSSLDAAEDFILSTRRDKKIYAVGCKQVIKEIKSKGINLSDDGEVVLFTFDRELTYDKINRAYQLLVNGAEFIITHPDQRCPAKEGFVPDLGSIVEIYKKAIDRTPDVIIGKPYSVMADNLVNKLGFEKQEIAMIGDRLNTDVAFGKNNGFLSVCVLSGETSLNDVEKSDVKPDLILKDINELPKIIG